MKTALRAIVIICGIQVAKCQELSYYAGTICGEDNYMAIHMTIDTSRNKINDPVKMLWNLIHNFELSSEDTMISIARAFDSLESMRMPIMSSSFGDDSVSFSTEKRFVSDDAYVQLFFVGNRVKESLQGRLMVDWCPNRAVKTVYKGIYALTFEQVNQLARGPRK